MANYLITGGCGFIGSHLADSLLKDGHEVRILDNLSTGRKNNVPRECRIIVGDVEDCAIVHSCMKDVDGCFHLAAISSELASNEYCAVTHQTNQTGSINIFDAARQEGTPVVYASSSEVYGDNADFPLKETSLARPLTAYGVDKLGSEFHARVASLMYDVPTLGLRFYNVYGPRQNLLPPYSGVISIFVDRLLNGEGVTIFGDGEQVRDFIYISDVVHFLRASMIKIRCNPIVLNVCTGDPVSINQLANMVMSIVGKRLPIEHQLSRNGDVRVSIGDPSYAKQHLGLEADYSITEGLQILIEYAIAEKAGALGIENRKLSAR